MNYISGYYHLPICRRCTCLPDEDSVIARLFSPGYLAITSKRRLQIFPESGLLWWCEHSNLNVVANDFFQPRKCQFLEHGVDKAFTEICKVEHADSRTIILATTRWEQCDGPGPRPIILAYLLGVVKPQRIQRKVGPCAVPACATRQIRVASVLA